MKRACFVAFLVFACGDDTVSDVGGDARADVGGSDADVPTDEPSKGPWVLQAETNSAMVRWETRVLPLDVTVEFTPEGGGESMRATGDSTRSDLTFEFGASLRLDYPDLPGPYFLQDVVIEGLAPATCYDYVIVGWEGYGGRLCTTHLPDDRTPIDLIVLGDTNPALGHTRRVLDHVLPTEPELIVHVGDLQYYSSVIETWQRFFVEMGPLFSAASFFPCIGNHEDELEGEYEAYYARLFDFPSRDGNTSRYHYTTGGVHFFAVNSEDDIGDYDPDFEWLDQAITEAESTAGYRFSVVYFHRPMYTLADAAPLQRIREPLKPILEAHDVPLVLQGHNHVYERFLVDGITYLVVGGGGAVADEVDTHVADYPDEVPLRLVAGDYYHAAVVRITADAISVRVIDEDGAVRDDFSIALPFAR